MVIHLLNNDTLESKFCYLDGLDSFSFVKNTQSVYQAVSNGFAQIVGWDSPKKAVSKTDYDIPSEIAVLADDFRNIDKLSLSRSGKTLTLEVMNSTSGWIALLVEKTPIVTYEGYIDGIYGHCFDVSYTNFFKYSQILSSIDQKIIPSTRHSAIYKLNPECSHLPLTPRQQECVFLLIRGKTVKQIADILTLSVRTIESYIEAIKYRLGCTHKSQIIEKAIASGFLYFVPKSLLN